MRFREFYESTGVDYDAFLRRMNGSEAFVQKYVKMFLADPTYTELAEMMSAGNMAEVSEKAHTLKGIALNMNLEKLGALCNEMVAIVRSGNTSNLATQFEAIKAEYDFIVKNLGS